MPVVRWCSGFWPPCSAAATAKLRYARNITDVDDKINAAAMEQGVPISTITDKFAAAYRDDMAMLGVSGDFAPDIEPAATAHIPHMIAMIQRLIDQGHAYAAEGHVLFAVDSFPDYGKLSRRDPEEMLAGARVEVAPYKRNPGDFVLWKPSTEGLPGWDSPWSVGRPGWHIECSAMAEAHLGETIDIHAGGVDLQFPHHENEVAQSECTHKHADGSHKTFARWWMHNGMLNFGGAKMAKSVGNIQRVHDLVREQPPEALRYALLSAHYRQPLEWSDALIEQSIKTLDRLYTARCGCDLRRPQHVDARIAGEDATDATHPGACIDEAWFARGAQRRPQHAAGISGSEASPTHRRQKRVTRPLDLADERRDSPEVLLPCELLGTQTPQAGLADSRIAAAVDAIRAADQYRMATW